MTDLTDILSRLGLAQYLHAFTFEGFESWETLLDITESDLEACGVKLGHRRVLQREIGLARGVSVDQLSSPTASVSSARARDAASESNRSTEVNRGNVVGGKRKYRRHPKPDDSAPERAPSAYVIFSNRIREELKPDNLSFTAIAKKVGGRWQDLTSEEREPFESEASTAKERYHAEMAEYKTTRSYREYQQYLAEFKAKNSSTSEGKRPKLVQEESTTSSGSLASQTECQNSPHNGVDSRQRRFESIGSGGPYSSARSTSGLPSPSSITSGPPVSRTGISSIVPLGTASSMPASPSTPSLRRESSIASSYQSTGQVRPSIESYSEQTAPPVLAPQPHRILTLDNKDAQTANSYSPGLFNRTRSPRRTSPLDTPRRSTRMPTLLQQHTSEDSSKSSIFSGLSNASTAPSSLFTPVTVDEEKKATMSLPPLLMVTRQPATGPYYDSAKSHDLHQLANRTASSYAQQQSPRSPFSPTASTDINRERHWLRNLTLDQDQPRTPTPSNARYHPEPQHPPHRPHLPTLPSMSHDEQPDPALPPNADPLSVLAYAGRIVGQEYRPPS